MLQLQDAGLGVFTVENKLKIFCKAPSDDLQPKLAKYNVSLEEYKQTFRKEDNKLTTSNIESILENHPFLEQVNALLEKEQLPQVSELLLQ